MNWGLLNEKNINKYKYIFIRTSCLYKLYNVHFAFMVNSRGCNLMPKYKISQYDAEMVADWYNGSNLVHSSIADNKQIKKLFEQSEKLRQKAHKIIVNDLTWKFEFKRGNQRQLKVKYNYEKGSND